MTANRIVRFYNKIQKNKQIHPQLINSAGTNKLLPVGILTFYDPYQKEWYVKH